MEGVERGIRPVKCPRAPVLAPDVIVDTSSFYLHLAQWPARDKAAAIAAQTIGSAVTGLVHAGLQVTSARVGREARKRKKKGGPGAIVLLLLRRAPTCETEHPPRPKSA